jgi:conjugal transfer/entry exclusion protein
MKRLYFTLLLTVLVLVNAAAQQTATAPELTFVFTRQSGHATNQFAVWIEDAQGQYIKTLYAANFTARGGWSRRPASERSMIENVRVRVLR